MITESTPTGGSPVERVVSAHTPGPWRVRTRNGFDGEIADCFVEANDVQGLPYGAEILGDDEYRDGIARKLADARLIAAAPDLLAAAQECMSCELGDMACVGSTAPAEHALGLLKAAIERSVGANA